MQQAKLAQDSPFLETRYWFYQARMVTYEALTSWNPRDKHRVASI